MDKQIYHHSRISDHIKANNLEPVLTFSDVESLNESTEHGFNQASRSILATLEDGDNVPLLSDKNGDPVGRWHLSQLCRTHWADDQGEEIFQLTKTAFIYFQNSQAVITKAVSVGELIESIPNAWKLLSVA